MQTGCTPLWAAAEKGHTQTVQRLLKAKANINHQSKVMITYIRTYMYIEAYM